jgi:hypothetical protein
MKMSDRLAGIGANVLTLGIWELIVSFGWVPPGFDLRTHGVLCVASSVVVVSLACLLWSQEVPA